MSRLAFFSAKFSLAILTTMHYALTVKYDGCCQPINPGGTASWGIVAWNSKGEEFVRACGIAARGREASNNVAEYAALCQALLLIQDVAAPGWNVLVQGDSKLTVMQLSGRWAVRGGIYLPHYEEAERLMRSLKDTGIWPKLEWIPREENKDADAESERALRQAGVPIVDWSQRKRAAKRGHGSYSRN